MEDIRTTRLDGLDEQIGYYESLIESGHKLSQQQRDHLYSLALQIQVFGEYGDFVYHYVLNLLSAV